MKPRTSLNFGSIGLLNMKEIGVERLAYFHKLIM